jgi:hypothetical protein
MTLFPANIISEFNTTTQIPPQRQHLFKNELRENIFKCNKYKNNTYKYPPHSKEHE